MKNVIKLALIGLALGSAASMAQDCTAPAVPAMPDGAKATEAEMVAGQTAVKKFQTDNAAYRACLDPKVAAAETAAAGDSPGPDLVEALKKLNEEYNASVSREEELAASFNTQLHAYKAANPG